MEQFSNKSLVLKRTSLYNLLLKHSAIFAKVVPFLHQEDRLLLMDFTSSNTTLADEVVNDTAAFSNYVNALLRNYAYGIGGYDELRTLYARSTVFDDKNEPRRLHLGTDIWGPEGTPVYAPLGGLVHSYAFNDNFGDYGATIILQHQLDGSSFNTLYGHLSLNDLANITEGTYVSRGQEFAHFGPPAENGHWPPHLHFQVVENMYEKRGDYPGVCKVSERDHYLANSPDADLILQMMHFAK